MVLSLHGLINRRISFLQAELFPKHSHISQTRKVYSQYFLPSWAWAISRQLFMNHPLVGLLTRQYPKKKKMYWFRWRGPQMTRDLHHNYRNHNSLFSAHEQLKTLPQHRSNIFLITVCNFGTHVGSEFPAIAIHSPTFNASLENRKIISSRFIMFSRTKQTVFAHRRSCAGLKWVWKLKTFTVCNKRRTTCDESHTLLQEFYIFCSI